MAPGLRVVSRLSAPPCAPVRRAACGLTLGKVSLPHGGCQAPKRIWSFCYTLHLAAGPRVLLFGSPESTLLLLFLLSFPPSTPLPLALLMQPVYL